MSQPQGSVEATRSLVRPIVTLALVGTMCGCAVAYAFTGADSALQAATFIGSPAGFVVGWWFKSRDDQPSGGSR